MNILLSCIIVSILISIFILISVSKNSNPDYTTISSFMYEYLLGFDLYSFFMYKLYVLIFVFT